MPFLQSSTREGIRILKVNVILQRAVSVLYNFTTILRSYKNVNKIT